MFKFYVYDHFYGKHCHGEKPEYTIAMIIKVMALLVTPCIPPSSFHLIHMFYTVRKKQPLLVPLPKNIFLSRNSHLDHTYHILFSTVKKGISNN